MWTIETELGGHIPFLIHSRRKDCIKAFNNWASEPWLHYRKLGWRCVPVMVHPMETPTKSTERTK